MSNINQRVLSRAFYEVMSDLAKSIDDPITLGWRDRDSQTSRFDVFVNNCVVDGDEILDFGSGLSDLYSYMEEKNIKTKYTGVELMPNFIEVAKERYGDNIKIYNTNILYFFGEFDWVFASGVFSVGFSLEEILEHVDHFLKVSRKGICFNLLNKEKFSGDVQVSFIPSEIVQILKEKYIMFDIELKDDYSFDDFSIIIRKK